MSVEIEARARAAYDAYAKRTGGRTFEGNGMMAWPDLPERIREAWLDAVKAALEHGQPIATPATPHPAAETKGRTFRTDDDQG